MDETQFLRDENKRLHEVARRKAAFIQNLKRQITEFFIDPESRPQSIREAVDQWENEGGSA